VVLVHKRQVLASLACETQMLPVTIAEKEADKHAACWLLAWRFQAWRCYLNDFAGRYS